MSLQADITRKEMKMSNLVKYALKKETEPSQQF